MRMSESLSAQTVPGLVVAEPAVRPAGDPDAEHLVRIAGGDRKALAELYARHQRALFRYLCQLTPDHGLAEEILQDSLVAVWQGAARFEARSSVRTWLFGIARRQAHNALRRRGLPLADAEAMDSLQDPDPGPEARLLSLGDAEELARRLALLPLIHREVLVLNFVHGLSYEEIAVVVGAPVGTVKSRLSNAKRALRQSFADDESGRGAPLRGHREE